MGRLSRYLRLLSEALFAILRLSCMDAPRFLVASVAPFLALATVVFFANRFAGAPWSHLTTVILFSCYAIAGLVWGILSGSRRVVAASLDWLEQTSPRLIDAIVDPVIQRISAAGQEVCIGDLRQSWAEATAALVVPRPPESAVPSLLSKFLNCVARRSLRVRTAALERFLSDLERKGHTHLSPDSLKAYLQEKLVAVARADARSKLAVIQCVGYPLTLLIVSLPLVLVSFWKGEWQG